LQWNSIWYSKFVSSLYIAQYLNIIQAQ
jgi:hypothetical protein